MGELEVYRRADGLYAWRLKSANGRIVATDGSQGYQNVGDAHAMAVRIIEGEFANAHITITRHVDDPPAEIEPEPENHPEEQP